MPSEAHGEQLELANHGVEEQTDSGESQWKLCLIKQNSQSQPAHRVETGEGN